MNTIALLPINPGTSVTQQRRVWHAVSCHPVFTQRLVWTGSSVKYDDTAIDIIIIIIIILVLIIITACSASLRVVEGFSLRMGSCTVARWGHVGTPVRRGAKDNKLGTELCLKLYTLHLLARPPPRRVRGGEQAGLSQHDTAPWLSAPCHFILHLIVYICLAQRQH